MRKFSVLMSVYRKENPSWFRDAVESIVRQTAIPSEILIVQDGSLTPELYHVCNELKETYPNIIHYLPLAQNVGLGLALQKGIIGCENELIARMDTDDIARPNRFELQLKAFEENPNLSVCGGFIQEFDREPSDGNHIRKVPLTQSDIVNFAKKRNPFNHMTVMFKKSAILEVGNYQTFPLLEDYFLWFRMIMAGKSMMNLPVVLVDVRGGNSMISRRGGLKYFKDELRLYRCFHKAEYISIWEMAEGTIPRLAVRLLSSNMRRIVYKLFLR